MVRAFSYITFTLYLPVAPLEHLIHSEVIYNLDDLVEVTALNSTLLRTLNRKVTFELPSVTEELTGTYLHMIDIYPRCN